MKHFIDIGDFTKDQLSEILKTAGAMKKKPSKYYSALQRKGLGIVFQKPSTRTRISFEVGMNQLGGFSLYLGPKEIQIGKREEVKDVARTMSRFLDVVALRTYEHDVLLEFAAHASVPVINGLTDLSHPCQAMADYMTLQEKFGDLSKIKVAYVGDGNNVLHSLLKLFSLMGVTLHYATPEGYEPKPEIVKEAEDQGRKSGAQIAGFHSAEEAVAQADVIYTDVFVSMGEENNREEKLKAFSSFQVNQQLLEKTGKAPLVMHCLPAHRGEEITEDVIEGKQSIVFDQAENRLHAQKGILYHLFKD